MPSGAISQFGVVLIVGSVAAADFESLIGPSELGLVADTKTPLHGAF